MANKRIQKPNPQATSAIYEDGKEMYERMFLDVMGEGIPGGKAVQAGANRWQTNVSVSMRNVFGPLANPNIFVYPEARWRSYLRDYVGPEGVNRLRYAMRMGLAGQGDATFMIRTKVHHQGMRAHNEKGNCFIGVSFRSKPDPAVTILSRTVTLTPMGLLDIAFGQLLAREWWKITKSSTPPTFNWYMGSICVTPFHSTILFGKLGLLDVVFDNSKTTLRTDKKMKVHGGPWPGSHYLEYPEDWSDYPPMYRRSVEMADKFIREPDYDRTYPKESPRHVYAQYGRMQRKLRNWLWGQEKIKPWVPTLPKEWFEDLYDMTAVQSKDQKGFILKEFDLGEDDFPKGQPLPENTDYDKFTTEEINWSMLT